MTGKEIENRVRILLNDADMVRWPTSEIVLWINDACRVIAGIRPDACIERAELALTPGTHQTITSLSPTPVRLLAVTHNSPGGRAIRLVDREQLDTTIPDWHSHDASETVRNYTFDNREPTTFFVFPPAAAGAKVSVVYSATPVTITVDNLESQELSLDDGYVDTIVNYVMYRAYGKDSETAGNAELAMAYRSAVEATLGIKTQADARFSPNFNSTAGKPTLAAQSGGI